MDGIRADPTHRRKPALYNSQLTSRSCLPLVLGLAFCGAAFLSSPAVVSAVVLADGDGTGNTTAPADDPGFANIGSRDGDASAVYLGNRWVLTAAHVKAGTVQLAGESYAHDPNTVQLVKNPPGLSENTDLVLFQLQEEPPLEALRLGCGPVPLGAEVLLIGQGRDRATDLTFWDVTRVAGEDNDIWQEVDDPALATREGFRTLPSRTIRWGRNQVSLTGVELELGEVDILSFQTSFDDQFALESEAQAVAGDSGGAVFFKNGPLWELAGVIQAASTFEKQPGGITTAVFGNNTFVSELSIYAESIRSIADFEPVPGDFDADGTFSSVDIDLLFEHLRDDGTVCHFDLDGDSVLSGADVDFLLSQIIGVLPGDANLDGLVEFADFLLLAQGFGKPGGWRDGDFSGDGNVQFEDFLLLSGNFGLELEPVTAAEVNVAAVAEPSAGALLLISLFVAFGGRRRARPLR